MQGQGHCLKTASDLQIIALFFAESNGGVEMLTGSSEIGVYAHA